MDYEDLRLLAKKMVVLDSKIRELLDGEPVAISVTVLIGSLNIIAEQHKIPMEVLVKTLRDGHDLWEVAKDMDSNMGQDKDPDDTSVH